MSRIRFNSAAEVFDAFATAPGDIGVVAGEVPPVAFLASLAADGQLSGAVAFLCYVLPRREAVWWSCQAVRQLSGALEPGEEAALAAAEAWVREPTEPRRAAALQAAMETDRTDPGHWCAFAAGWSSGSFGQSEPRVPVQPFLTARNAMLGVLFAAERRPPDERDARLLGCIRAGTTFAEGGSLIF